MESKNTEIHEGIKIPSPIIGTAYLAPEPGGKKFADVGKKIKKGDYSPNKVLKHSHVGSLGNLSLEKIREKMKLFLT